MNRVKWLWAIPALLLAIQFVRIDKNNPPADPERDFLAAASAPAGIASTIKASCYDCHSYHTQYPWYSNVAPVSWILRNHIVDGRKHLNFSDWTSYPPGKQQHKLEECAEVVGKGEMPMKGYVWMHPDAGLDEAKRQQLVDWFNQGVSGADSEGQHTGDGGREETGDGTPDE